MSESLTTILAQEPHPSLDALASYAALTTKTLTRPSSEPFYSFRSLAGVLTDAEYTTVKSVLTALAASSDKVADMVEMLKIPGDRQGNRGGIDFSSTQLQSTIDSIVAARQFTDELGAKLKGLGFEPCSWADLNHPGLRLIDVIRAKRSIGQ